MYIRSNYFVSTLNTNFMLASYLTNNQYAIYRLQTRYTPTTSQGAIATRNILCGLDNLIYPVGFFPDIMTTATFTRATWLIPTEDIPTIEGFFAGCTPLEGILASTLDCLYHIECIQLLISYFPTLKQQLSSLNLNQSVLSGERSNKTVYDYISNVFIDEWLTEMNYSKYFSACAPSSCSYRTTDPVNWSYAITIFISLYGGLIIILRLISQLIIEFILKLKKTLEERRNTLNNRISIKIYGQQLLKSIKQMNIFRNINERSVNEIKQQQMMTYIYFFLLFCMFFF